jgi:hypothetical protein
MRKDEISIAIVYLLEYFLFYQKNVYEKNRTSFLVLSIALFMANCGNNQSAENTSSAPKADSTSLI